MEQYIDKDAISEKINRRLEVLSKDRDFNYLQIKELKALLSSLDALEVKEVDLDEAKIGETQIYIEDDGGEPPYGGKQWIDLGCLEYEIPKDKFKDGDNVEVIIRKIRK